MARNRGSSTSLQELAKAGRQHQTRNTATMSALRASRAALRARSAFKAPLQRRGYADAVSDKIKLSLSLPHSVCCAPVLTLRCRIFAAATNVQANRFVVNLQVERCVRNKPESICPTQELMKTSVQVNLAAESGEMGILAQHVPSIEQLKPGLVEVIEEAGGSKQFFRKRSTYYGKLEKR